MVLFLVGLAASIPLSIFANLMTNRLLRAWSKRSAAAEEEDFATQQQLSRTGAWFADNPDAFRAYLSREMLKALIFLPVLAAGMMMVITVLLGADTSGGEFRWSQLPKLIVFILAIPLAGVSAVSFYTHIFRALSLFSAVRRTMQWPIDPEDLDIAQSDWEDFQDKGGRKPAALDEPSDD